MAKLLPINYYKKYKQWFTMRKPIGSMVLQYIYQHLPHKSPNFVGKYTTHGAIQWHSIQRLSQAMRCAELLCRLRNSQTFNRTFKGGPFGAWFWMDKMMQLWPKKQL